jgi:hypothetical protein
LLRIEKVRYSARYGVREIMEGICRFGFQIDVLGNRVSGTQLVYPQEHLV